MNAASPRASAGCAAARGYTLIEVMVVVAIVSMTIGLVAVKLGPDERSALEDEARRLAMLLQHARNEALILGTVLAWTPDADGYRIRVARRGESRGERANERAFADGNWRTGTRLEGMRVAGLPVPPDTPLVFSASGFNPPYELRLAAGSWRIALSGQAGGAVDVGPAVPAAEGGS